MQDVAADRDDQAFQPAAPATDGQGIEQRLGRVLVLPVAGVDHAARNLLGEKFDRPGGRVADHEKVRTHGVDRHGGVEHRFALRQRRGRGGHVDHVGTEALAADLEGALRARRGFEKEIDLGAAAERRMFPRGLPRQLHVAVG